MAPDRSRGRVPLLSVWVRKRRTRSTSRLDTDGRARHHRRRGAPTDVDLLGHWHQPHVYAQIVDKNTGLVVGNIVTPIPVTWNGRPTRLTSHGGHRLHVRRHVPEGADLELQIVGSATPYLNLTQYGFINVIRCRRVAADAGNWRG